MVILLFYRSFSSTGHIRRYNSHKISMFCHYCKMETNLTTTNHQIKGFSTTQIMFFRAIKNTNHLAQTKLEQISFKSILFLSHPGTYLCLCFFSKTLQGFTNTLYEKWKWSSWFIIFLKQPLYMHSLENTAKYAFLVWDSWISIALNYIIFKIKFHNNFKNNMEGIERKTFWHWQS